MSDDTRVESTTVTDIPSAIEASIKKLRTGLDGSNGFAIVFVSTRDDGTMEGSNAFGELTCHALLRLCEVTLKMLDRVSAPRGGCDCPTCGAAGASRTTH